MSAVLPRGAAIDGRVSIDVIGVGMRLSYVDRVLVAVPDEPVELAYLSGVIAATQR